MRRSTRDPDPELEAEDAGGFPPLRRGEFRPVEALDAVMGEALHAFDEISLLIIVSQPARMEGAHSRIGVRVDDDGTAGRDNRRPQVSTLWSPGILGRLRHDDPLKMIYTS